MPYKDPEKRRAYLREYNRTHPRSGPRGPSAWSEEKAERVFAESGKPRPLCECGCGGQTSIARQTRTGRGQVAGKPLRFINGHHSRKTWGNFVEDPITNCWEWMGRRTKGGYGQLMLKRKVRYAHRFYYEAFIGPIPEGLQIDHLCRNRACVNPGHLEVVTSAENSRRSPLIGRMPGSRGNRGKARA